MNIKEIINLQPQPEGRFLTIADTPKIVKDKLKEIKKKLPKNIFTEIGYVSLNPNTYCVCYRGKEVSDEIERFWLITGCANVRNEVRKHYNIIYRGSFFSHWNYYEITDKEKI